jgi:hypothetical protein
MKINNIYFILGFLFFIDGILTIYQGTISLGLLIATELDDTMKYVIGIVQILFGIYIFFILYSNKLK